MAHDERKLPVEGRALLRYETLFDWKSEYDLGIPIIDAQHRGLAAALNSLHFAIVNHLGDTMLDPTIEMVKAYAGVHFTTEELLFRQCGYPDAERHAALHNKLLETMFERGQESLFNQDAGEFLDFLKNWLITHVLREDRAYRNYFSRALGDGGTNRL